LNRAPTKAIKRIPTPSSNYSADNPQDGCWWHALDAGGRCLFETKSPFFGRPTPETVGSVNLGGKRCIRCRPSRDEVQLWVPADGSGGVVKIRKGKVAATDWETAGQQGDIHVLGSTALLAGIIET